MSTITNLKFDDSSVEFDWDIARTGNSWTQESELFPMDSSKRQCSLSMICEHKSMGLHDVSFEINIADCYQYYKDKRFELKVCIELNHHKSNGIFFTLNRASNSSKKFKSREQSIYSTRLFNYYEARIYIKLTCLKPYSDYTLLLQGIKQLFLNEEYTDFKIVTNDRVFKVHKNILSIRSPVFNRMIDTNMREKQTGEIKLEQWDSTVVEQILLYIYTGTCELETFTYELFRLAHFLEMSELQNLCVQYLKNNFNEDKVVATLRLANESDDYGLQKLKKAAESFVERKINVLSKRADYADYLCETINLSNITYVLSISHQNSVMEHTLLKAMEFVRQNHEEILQNEHHKTFLLNNPKILLQIFEYSLPVYKSLGLCKKEEVKEEDDEVKEKEDNNKM